MWFILIIALFIQVPDKCPVNKDGKHVMVLMEKCAEEGCGGWCNCSAFKEYTTRKWFPSKDSAWKYLKISKTKDGKPGY